MIAGAAAAQMVREAMSEDGAGPRSGARAVRPEAVRPRRLRGSAARALRAIADRLEPTCRMPERA